MVIRMWRSGVESVGAQVAMRMAANAKNTEEKRFAPLLWFNAAALYFKRGNLREAGYARDVALASSRPDVACFEGAVHIAGLLISSRISEAEGFPGQARKDMLEALERVAALRNFGPDCNNEAHESEIRARLLFAQRALEDGEVDKLRFHLKRATALARESKRSGLLEMTLVKSANLLAEIAPDISMGYKKEAAAPGVSSATDHNDPDYIIWALLHFGESLLNHTAQDQLR